VSNDPLLTIIAGRDTQGYIEVRCRNPRTGFIDARAWFPLDDRAACQRYIAARAEHLDVYVGVAPRTEHAGGKAAIRHSWLLYVDADSAEAVKRVRRFIPAPSLIVRSGTGSNVHAYWSLAEPVSPAWFERANRRLAHHLGADIKVTDAARILRPPGSLNHRTEPPVRVTIEHFQHPLHPVPVWRVVGRLVDPVTHAPRREHRPGQHDASDPLLGISADDYYAALTGRPVTAGNVQCPFHSEGKERTPSMRLYDTTWFCWGCNAGGSIYQFGSHLWDMGTRGVEFHRLRERLTDALR